MRVVLWNCGGGLRKKLAAVEALAADILIIQKCENPQQAAAAYQGWAGDCLWAGESKYKGLGVFSKTEKAPEALD